jgi:predicted Zn-dependent protease
VVGHVVEKVSLTRLLVVLDVAFQFIIGTNTNLAGIALMALVALPNSRTQELEADLVGLRLMSTACFDPEAVVKCVRYLGVLVSSLLTLS